MEQGRVAACHAFGLPYKTHVAPLTPFGVFTIPEISMVGATEEELKAKGVDYEVGRARYEHNARGQIIGESDGALKLLFDKATKRLLGVHIIGDRATELIHIGQMVMSTGGTIDVFIDSVFTSRPSPSCTSTPPTTASAGSPKPTSAPSEVALNRWRSRTRRRRHTGCR